MNSPGRVVARKYSDCGCPIVGNIVGNTAKARILHFLHAQLPTDSGLVASSSRVIHVQCETCRSSLAWGASPGPSQPRVTVQRYFQPVDTTAGLDPTPAFESIPLLILLLLCKNRHRQLDPRIIMPRVIEKEDCFNCTINGRLCDRALHKCSTCPEVSEVCRGYPLNLRWRKGLTTKDKQKVSIVVSCSTGLQRIT